MLTSNYYQTSPKSLFRHVGYLLLCTGLSLSSCKKKETENVNPEIPGTVTPTPVPEKISATTVASNLDTPWQIAFAPDGRLFFTERIGYVKVVKNGQPGASIYLSLRDSVKEASEAGLTGIVFDPKFNENRYFYLAYSYEKPLASLKLWNKIVRYKEDAGNGLPIFDKILIDSIEGYLNHNLGSLHFGPDDKLYITTGEIYKPPYAQDMSKLNGKILRIERDGSIPSDNPFPGSPIYTLGHRNVQGLAWQPETNNLFNVEHGPSQQQGCCQDEINVIERGKNYGWPNIRGSQTHPDYVTPVFNSSDSVTWAPCQNVFVPSGPWKGSMLFTGLFDKALHRAVIDPTNPKKILTVETYLRGKYGRLRALAVGPDGKIYVSTSNGDGTGIAVSPDDDRIMVLDILP